MSFIKFNREPIIPGDTPAPLPEEIEKHMAHIEEQANGILDDDDQ